MPDCDPIRCDPFVLLFDSADDHGVAFSYAGDTREKAEQTLREYAQSIQHGFDVTRQERDSITIRRHRSLAVYRVYIHQDH
jgi:hypothetical protein